MKKFISALVLAIALAVGAQSVSWGQEAPVGELLGGTWEVLEDLLGGTWE